ncbi:MAG: class I SAM-dependent methyltransferase, partial [Selenomonas sp.]|nr:class I SAM-dependent methyltransferase [Selenomonas sp.]
MFKEELQKAAAEYGINLSETQIAQYNRYFELLIEWNEKINLTAITAPKDVAIKHIIDSITAYDAA